MHAKFCVKRPNGVGVYFTEDRHTDRLNENSCPFSGLGPFTVVNYSVGITDCPLGKDPHCGFDYHLMFITFNFYM